MPDEVQRFGTWRLIGFADAKVAKVALVRCDCGQISRVSYEALVTGGHVVCPTCKPPLAPNHYDRSFARDAAQAEGRSARKRHFGKDT
jgi:hypothetical protein